jgi:CDP-glucose 4,6-dehydratase
MVRDIARQFVKRWGHGSIIEAKADAGPHEAHYLKLDSSKAVAELGWQPILSAQERLEWTVDWYKCRQENPESIWKHTRRQIELAEEKIRELNRFAQVWNGDSIQSQAA